MWTDVFPQYLPSVVSELLQLFLEVGEVLWQDGQLNWQIIATISLLPCRSGGIFYIIREETIYLLCKGSRSRRLWESPPVPSERYERRSCLCRFRCTCRSRIFFTIRQKRIRGGVRSLKVPVRH